MVPVSLPRADLIVTVTGWLEIIGAILIVIPTASKAATIFLTIMLIAMFPANIRASREKLPLARKEAILLKARTLVPIVFFVAVVLAGV